MIKNIIFDMAFVLFTYEPLSFTKRFVPNDEDANLINDVVFCSPEWELTDRGKLSDEEYLNTVLARLPARLHETARYLFGHWHEQLKPDGNMEKLISKLKERGYKIYLLTNMSGRFHMFYKTIPAMKHFDGAVVSADEHCVKPEPEIYNVLFKKFGLKPEECFFIDDRPENIETGKKLGMRGFCYKQDIGKLTAALKAEGVSV